jgi:hypothetical protein
MNEYAIRLAKPHCEKCHNPKIKPGALVYTGDGQPVRTITMDDASELARTVKIAEPSSTVSLLDRLRQVTSHPDEEDI